MAGILDMYPEYRSTARLDELRESEYSYLGFQDHVYLDYTGSGLASQAQRRHHQDRLAQTIYGNPHSVNPTSAAATEAVEKTRARVLAHVNASPAEYAVIFTSNATAAARLVGEAYPFRRGTRFVLTADNHNSINGIREFARARKATTTYIPLQSPDLRIDSADVVSALSPKRGLIHRPSLPSCRGILGRPRQSGRCKGLFAYPAQSNFTGVRHSLAWIPLAQQRGYHVLLDAAAFLPTSALDLSEVRPDFVLVSWYKLFGYPTGVGCLIARRDALACLERPWFSGGTIRAATAGVPWHLMAEGGEAFEDGTLNFMNIPDVHFGLDWLARIGMSVIDTRVRCLTGWFLARLQQLRHSDGSPMVRVYGPTDLKMRGGTVAFNFLDLEGNVVDERIVALESAAAKISLRTGCFCNPGAGEAALGLDTKAFRRLVKARVQGLHQGLDEFIEVVGLRSAGAVRVSFGFASTTADVDRFFGFAEKTYKDRVTMSEGLPRREQC
ncbi:Molybdenum cofactor sulfurase [Madurella mycetomatis]|uniref:Molybdenum cofactor sulfurase n=1 Tax=Madurella mycetomatis TaxID=100816 RepID=A0A175VWU7_9PEZI|nr:Molybdenum cofactor sulfurase [Madurella mycetomatis]